MKRIGIYGGAFNPPHIGHIAGAKYALKALGLERLLLIPSCVSPHKPLPENSPDPAQRLEMLRLAATDLRMEVSDLEFQRGGTSYTYETVEQVRQQYPDAELILLMGTDMFLSFNRWRAPERIVQNVSLAVMCRGEKKEQEQIQEKIPVLEQMGAKIYVLENPVTEISSSDLRRMVVFGCAAPYLAPEVADYICANGLYAGNRSRKSLPIDALQKEVESLLKPSRVAHVLGCRDAAVDLAKRWGVNETDAARAALLHDITKALDGQQQLALCEFYGAEVDAFSRRNTKILHAYTGSLVARRIFGENDAVVEAIRTHTSGEAGMNLLQKIIYVADYMEPNRDFDGVEELRCLAYTDIDKALKMGITWATDILRQQGREISPDSLEAMEELTRKGI